MSFWLLFVALAFTPYYLWAHLLLGGPTIFGKSAFLGVVAGALALVGLLRRHEFLNRLGGWWFLIVYLLLIAGLLLRVLVYEEPVGTFLVGARFIVTSLLYGAATLPFLREARARAWLSRLVLINCLLQAVIGIVHTIYFPHVVTGIPLDDTGQGIYVLPLGEGGFRENGTLVSANTYGAFLVFGLLLLFAPLRRLDWRRGLTLRALWHRLLITLAAGLLWWGIILSDSRYALAGAVVVTGYAILRALSPYWMPFFALGGTVAFLASSAFAHALERFATGGSGSRGAKAALAWGLLEEHVAHVLIGVPEPRLLTAVTADGLAFSDNSFLSMLLSYGFPVTLLFLLYLTLVWRSLLWPRGLRGWTGLTVLFILGQLAVTNALYWDNWVIYAGATLLLVRAREGERTRTAPRSEVVGPSAKRVEESLLTPC